MSSFTEARLVRTDLVNAAGRPFYRVEGAEGRGFTFYVGSPDSGLALHVPEGFLTDRASWLTRARRRALTWCGLGWLIRWVDDCLAKAAVVHDRLREDLAFELEDCDGYFWVAMSADLNSWRGPRWARLALREIAFRLVRTNGDRIQHNALLQGQES